MSKQNNIFLVGPMGSGKTCVGSQLATLMRYHFYDTDKEIEKRTGVSISWIFEVETESGFRKREMDVIKELSSRSHVILSTGGGSVVTPVNCELLKERGFVVYLTVDPRLQYERTKRHRGHRPLIDCPDAKERLAILNAQRQPLYAAIADKIYCTDNHSPHSIAENILKDFNNYAECCG